MLKNSFSFFHSSGIVLLGICPYESITLSMSRPVKIKRIEKEIITQYENRGDAIINEIEDGIVYLRKERFFKTDAANLLVGSVRGLGNINRQIALNLGFKFLPELPTCEHPYNGFIPR